MAVNLEFRNSQISKALKEKNSQRITCEKCRTSIPLLCIKNHKCHEYTCECCGIIFYGKIRSDRKIRCKKCTRNVLHSIENPNVLFDLSLRTIAKIIKRAGIKCMMCGWDKTSLDVHHIIHKAKGGTDEDSNLICVCPNCHRMAHENQYKIEELQIKSIAVLFSNWRDFYHPSN
jgi:hypothetical protein